MTTLTEHIVVAGAENRPPMLEKSMYDSWASHTHLFIKGKKHGRMMLDSIENGLLVYPTVEENGQIRTKNGVRILDEARQLVHFYFSTPSVMDEALTLAQDKTIPQNSLHPATKEFGSSMNSRTL
ncbi:hypothetical protein Tco_0967800 [Tanacetum coccineum]